MKLIGCTVALEGGGVLDPVEAFLVGGERFLLGRLQFGHSRRGVVLWLTLTEDPCVRRTTVCPGSSTRKCRGMTSLVPARMRRVKEIICDVAVVQVRDAGVGGLDLFTSEKLVPEPQHAEPAGTSPVRIAGRDLRAGRAAPPRVPEPAAAERCR